MREIISIQCGQAGNQVSTAFWDTIIQEHGLDNEGHLSSDSAGNDDHIDVFFSESGNKRYIPRAVAVDLEPATIDAIRSSSIGDLFRPDNLISGESGAGNNWAKGYYTEGAELMEPVMDSVRREAENTDAMQGFQIVHSLGGGTGSGMGTRMMAAIRDEYSDRMISTYSVMPSPKVSETVTEPYNAVMALHYLVESSDATHCLDNEALYNICSKTLKITHPTHNDLNKLIAKVMSGVTTGFRFPGQLNGDLRKLATNLVPFTRLHFFTTAYAPLFATNMRSYQNLGVPELTQQLFNPSNIMAACNPVEGKYLTISTIFRGAVSTKEVDDCIQAAYDRNQDLFVKWIPNNFQTSVCSTPTRDANSSATFVANTTAVQELFTRSGKQFDRMFNRKAFLHWYTAEGMDEGEFSEAMGNIEDLVREYNQYQNATVDEDFGEYADEYVEYEGDQLMDEALEEEAMAA